MKNPATHLSFGVSDVKKTSEFYKNFFEIEPAKIKKDYVKFELENPAMVISFIQSQTISSKSGEHFHFGIRYGTTDEVLNKLESIKKSNIEILEEKNVSCCYAVQDKFWVKDPDGLRWEVYTYKEDTESLKTTSEGSNCCSFDSELSESEDASACC